jgi:hypothetical protein
LAAKRCKRRKNRFCAAMVEVVRRLGNPGRTMGNPGRTMTSGLRASHWQMFDPQNGLMAVFSGLKIGPCEGDSKGAKTACSALAGCTKQCSGPQSVFGRQGWLERSGVIQVIVTPSGICLIDQHLKIEGDRRFARAEGNGQNGQPLVERHRIELAALTFPTWTDGHLPSAPPSRGPYLEMDFSC